MNFKTVFRVAGFTLLVEAAAMLLPMGVALYYGEDPSPFLKTIGIMVVLGMLSVFALRGQRKFFAREATGWAAWGCSFSPPLCSPSWASTPPTSFGRRAPAR